MPHTLLIVDDDPNILETAVDILEDAGFQIKTAARGDIALDVLKGTPIDLVISDINLPDLKGDALAHSIHAAHPKTKIILMSGQQDVDSAGIKHLVQAILLKPVNPQDLVTLIKKTLDE